jgi:hypothetical protein
VANSILPKTSPFLISASSNSHHLLRGDFAELFEGGFEIFDTHPVVSKDVTIVPEFLDDRRGGHLSTPTSIFQGSQRTGSLKVGPKTSLIETRSSGGKGVALGKVSLANRIKSSGVL